MKSYSKKTLKQFTKKYQPNQKSQLGKISKIIIKQINKRLLDVLEYQQWKNTTTAINLFKRTSNKE